MDEVYVSKINFDIHGNKRLTFYSSSSNLIPKTGPNDGYHMNVRYVNYYLHENGKVNFSNNYKLTASIINTMNWVNH